MDRLARTADRLWQQGDVNPRLTQEVGEGEREGDGEVEDSWKKGVLLGIFHEYQFRAFLSIFHEKLSRGIQSQIKQFLQSALMLNISVRKSFMS